MPAKNAARAPAARAPQEASARMEAPPADPRAADPRAAQAPAGWNTATNQGLDPGADMHQQKGHGSAMFPPSAQGPMGPGEGSEPRNAEQSRRTRNDRATHIGLGHGDGPSPAAAARSARSDGSSSDIIPHVGAGRVQVRSAPVSEAPPTQPKPRGEPTIPEARATNAARVRPRPNLERRPVDDEVTMQRDITALHAQLAATRPGVYDDLDEETSVIQREGLRLAAEARAAAAGTDDSRASSRNPDVGGSHEVGGSTDVVDETPTENPLGVPSELWASKAKVSVRAASLPAVRVAVLGTSIAGEVRLVTLAPGSQVPMGAATAFLVPLTEEDAECIAKLFETSP